MAIKNYSYLGKGPIYAGEKGGALLPVGNCSSLNFAASENKLTQPDYTRPEGGAASEVSRINEVTGSLTILDLSPKNLALGYRGATSIVAGGVSVTDERHTAYVGGLLALDDLPDISDPGTTITVTKDPDGTPAVMVLDTDYEVTRAGLVVKDGGALSDGDTVGVDYDKTDSVVMQALVESGKEFHLVFDGLNEAQSGKAVTVTAHRIKFSPTQGSGLIGDEFAELSLDFSVLADPDVSGSGISKFFKVAMES